MIYDRRVELFRRRGPRTVVLTLAGLVAAFLGALVLGPALPEYCGDAGVGPCDREQFQTLVGYLVIALGIGTIILGPVVGSLIHVYLHGAHWETPRGTETVITNMPLLIGAIYLGIGILVLATT